MGKVKECASEHCDHEHCDHDIGRKSHDKSITSVYQLRWHSASAFLFYLKIIISRGYGKVYHLFVGTRASFKIENLCLKGKSRSI